MVTVTGLSWTNGLPKGLAWVGGGRRRDFRSQDGGCPLKVGNEPSRREIDFIGMRDYSPRYPREKLFPGKSI